jgi:cell division septation protein DedD
MENNTSVIVPDLGCFTIISKPSEIHDGIVSPPVKTVVFDSENSADDRLLTQYIAIKEMITVEQATEKVRNFYSYYFLNKLIHEKEVVFEKFGVFSLDKLGNIVFAPDTDFFKDNYGLGYVHIPGEATSQLVEPDHKNIFNSAGFATEDKPEPKPETNDVLFDTSDNTRFRENNERRRKYEPEQQPPVTPKSKTTVPPSKKKQKPVVRENKQKRQQSGGSSLWVLWVLLIAAALGVGGFFAYPIVSKHFSNNTKTNATAIVEPETKSANTGDTEQDTPNPDVAEALDHTIEKKNALDPAIRQQTTSTPTREQTTAPSTSVPAVQTQEGGKYVLIVGSFSKRSAAEALGRKLQAEGFTYEIIDAVAKGDRWFRVSVAGFDDKAEAFRQANQMKPRPYCENIWVAKR